jgi:hypothetical protein
LFNKNIFGLLEGMLKHCNFRLYHGIFKPVSSNQFVGLWRNLDLDESSVLVEEMSAVTYLFVLLHVEQIYLTIIQLRWNSFREEFGQLCRNSFLTLLLKKIRRTHPMCSYLLNHLYDKRLEF